MPRPMIIILLIAAFVSAATEMGYSVSAFDIMPNLFYPYLLLVSSLVFIYLVPQKNK